MSKRSQRLPERIEPLQLARAGRTLVGRVPVARLRRLADLLSDHEGFVDVVLEFGRDEVGNFCVCGSLAAELSLICQRCLGTVRQPVNAEVRLGLITAEAQAERLDRGYEPLLVAEEPMALVTLLEDELLLALPQVARHGEQECTIAEAYRCDGAAAEEAAPARENPFAVLEKLKKDR